MSQLESKFPNVTLALAVAVVLAAQLFFWACGNAYSARFSE